MYAYKPDNSIPIKVWTKEGEIEQGAIEQIENTAKLPFAYHHVALMADAHRGYGAPIGGVMATRGVVIPNFVGVDIGCGVCALKTSHKAAMIEPEHLTMIVDKIKQVIPVGFNKHSDSQEESLMPRIDDYETDCFETEFEIVYREYDNALCSLGTLGGGNHFIEIQKDTDGYVWIMIHSGSRNLGYKIAQHYNKLAIQLNKRWYTQVPEKWGLAFLPLDTEIGQAYVREMNYAVEYALANRRLMMSRIMSLLPTNIDSMINIAHNYAQMENHYKQNVMVHRKGATLAREGQLGIIPGSQGTKSYLVEGLGNPQSFQSCSHGAGRVMGRKQAQRELDLYTEQKRLDDQGIIHSIKEVKDLDEASGAYKLIEKVMANQEDLVRIITELTPLAVIKG